MSRRWLIAGVAIVIGLSGGAELGRGVWIAGKAVVAQHLLGRAWAEARSTGAPVRAWPWADSWPVARIHVPRLAASAVVLSDTSGESLAFGPAHLPATPRPGAPGLSFIAGHRDTHFAFLRNIAHGDLVEVDVAGAPTSRYRVTAISIVDSSAVAFDPFDRGVPALALVTCWPFGSTEPNPDQRFVVVAEAAAAPDRGAPD